jgi:ribosomal protein L37AE/L43A
MSNVDTYCGLYCGSCSILRYGETGRADVFVECCGVVPRQEMRCGGCKSDQLYPGCRACDLRECARKKGVERCFECREYPCRSFSGWQSAAKLVPHVGQVGANVAAMRRDGVDAWLAAQEQRWACPGCGARFSWYAKTCGECGRSLAGQSYELSGLRRLACRVVFPLMYYRAKRRMG